ncbi:MAG: hypothetical protein K6C34_01030 [Alphaproteobacteria bacterium]|nr:hypothetical protein [Alphaproteobacteria bacterium]
MASTTGSIVRQPVDDDDEESVKVVDVTGIDHSSKDTVIDLSGTVSIQCPAFREVSEVSDGGVAWMNGITADIFKDLTEDQQRYIATCAVNGNFNPGSIEVNFWKFVSYVSDPIGNLAKVAVVVLPLLASSGYGVSDSEHSDYSGIATSIAGVISLTFDKICYYANEKIANHEKVCICLQTMKNAKKD